MSDIDNRVVEIRGVCIHPDYKGDFSGEILLESRKDCVYYIWTLHRVDGTFLGSKSVPVSFKVIPNGENPFEYALNHAIVGINRYRMGRTKAFHVENWQWKD
jgi:hypothetical protein